MKTNLRTILQASFVYLLMIAATACSKKEQGGGPTPAPTPKSVINGVVDGFEIDIKDAKSAFTYYANDGDAVKALSISTDISYNGKIAFYIADLKPGTITLTKKLGTSANPVMPGIKVNETGSTSNTTQTYFSYTVSGNTYYAYAGTIQITINGNTATIKWDVTFKDAAGKDFKSTGQATIVNFNALPNPKSAIIDPTPISFTPTIENISSVEGLVGDTIFIAGVNYSTVLTDNKLKFNGVSARIIAATTTKLTVKVPQATTGKITLAVKNSAELTGPTYTFIGTPTITSISPEKAKIGDTIVIKGTNFSTLSTENKVTFSGVSATVVAASATQLLVIVPATLPANVAHTLSVIVKGRVIANISGFNVKLPGMALQWQELSLTGSLKDRNQFATYGNKIMFTSYESGFKYVNYLYLSTDGINYSNVINNLKAATGNDFYDPMEIKMLAAGSDAFYVLTNGGVAKSKDGITWTYSRRMGENVRAMVVNGENVTLVIRDVLAVSLDGYNFEYKSINIPDGNPLLYVSNDNNGQWYAISPNFGVYKSTDYGVNWIAAQAKASDMKDIGFPYYGDFFQANSSGAFLLRGPEVLNTVERRSSVRLYKLDNQTNTWSMVINEVVTTVKSTGSTVMYGGLSFNVSNDGGENFTRYLAPEGWLISGIEKMNGYYYVSCYNADATKAKIFRAPIL